MKNSLIAVIGILALAAIFGGLYAIAEQVDEEYEIRSYDVSHVRAGSLYLSDGNQYNIPEDLLRESEDFFGDYRYNEIDDDYFYWHITGVTGKDVWNDEERYIREHLGVLYLRNTPKILDQAELAISPLLAKASSYDVRVGVFKAGDQIVDIDKLDRVSFGKAAGQLIAAKYNAVSDQTTTLPVGKPMTVADIRLFRVLADYEGLIATVANVFDPVVYNYGSGLVAHMQANEDGDSVLLRVSLLYGEQTKSETTHVRGMPLDLPEKAESRIEKTFTFNKNGVQAISLQNDSGTYILLFELR